MERIKKAIKTVDFAKEGKSIVCDYLVITLGVLMMGVSFAFFFLPHDIAPGGVTGIATILASVIPLGVGLISFLINLPLFALGYRSVGWRFAFRSFAAMLLLSLFIDLIPMRDMAGDRMLAAIFGGVLMGIGLGLVVRAGATTGGTDMAAILVHKYASLISVPNILLGIDGLVVVIAALAFGFQAGLYALVTIFTYSKAMDVVIKGFNTALQFLIISGNEAAIVKRIHNELDRGCTRLESLGTYSGQSMGTLLCVLPRLEAARLKKIIAEEDPGAFVTICDVHEALGEGFTYASETDSAQHQNDL